MTNITNITLPDGSVRSFESAVNGQQLAESIGAGLAKAAIAVKVNGVQRDLSEPLADGDKVQILTLKDAEGLEIMRHTTTAQALARAVLELFEGSIVAMGPTIEDGFYHDISCSKSITLEDLPRIEARMKEIIDAANPVQREVWAKADVIAHFQKLGNKYKPEILANVPPEKLGDKISVYRQTLKDGSSFVGIRLRSSTQEVMRDVYGQNRAFPLDQIVGVRELETSFMPSGLAYGLTDRELRDLVTYLSQ
jgi:threonyl-tRNA synthetase